MKQLIQIDTKADNFNNATIFAINFINWTKPQCP